MLDEHAEARRLTAAMSAGAERLESGDARARDDVARSALAYAALLRDHIAKEDRVLFPMAGATIRDTAAAEMAAVFERLERVEAAQRLHERYRALAEALEREASLR
jgi:hemerythrin-like domain-containing protein